MRQMPARPATSAFAMRLKVLPIRARETGMGLTVHSMGQGHVLALLSAGVTRGLKSQFSS